MGVVFRAACIKTQSCPDGCQARQTCNLSKHLRYMKRVSPPIVEQFAVTLEMLVENMLLEIGDFFRSQGSSEIEQKRPIDDGHFDCAQWLVEIDELGNCMAGNIVDFFGSEDQVDF